MPSPSRARHLRFLVVDETDRLLRQSYQDWLPHVLAALPAADAPASCCGPALLPVCSTR